MAEYEVKERPERAPSHPGVLLAEALENMGAKIAPTAKLLNISRNLLHNILAGKAPITPRVAVRIGKLCGNGPNIWANMQTNFDLWHEAKVQKKALEKIPTLAA